LAQKKKKTPSSTSLQIRLKQLWIAYQLSEEAQQ